MTNSYKDNLQFYKKGIFQLEDKNSSENAYLHTILYVPDSFLTTKFHDILFKKKGVTNWLKDESKTV